MISINDIRKQIEDVFKNDDIVDFEKNIDVIYQTIGKPMVIGGGMFADGQAHQYIQSGEVKNLIIKYKSVKIFDKVKRQLLVYQENCFTTISNEFQEFLTHYLQWIIRTKCQKSVSDNILSTMFFNGKIDITQVLSLDDYDIYFAIKNSDLPFVNNKNDNYMFSRKNRSATEIGFNDIIDNNDIRFWKDLCGNNGSIGVQSVRSNDMNAALKAIMEKRPDNYEIIELLLDSGAVIMQYNDFGSSVDTVATQMLKNQIKILKQLKKQ